MNNQHLKAITKNPAATAEVLEQLLIIPNLDQEVYENIASHPAATAEILKK